MLVISTPSKTGYLLRRGMSGWSCLVLLSVLHLASARSLSEQRADSQQSLQTAVGADASVEALANSQTWHLGQRDVSTGLEAAQLQTDSQALATVDEELCAESACGVVKAASCLEQDSADPNLNFVYQSTRSCGVVGYQHRCCAQTCKADVDCPAQYFCQGFNSGQKYCYKCHNCPLLDKLT